MKSIWIYLENRYVKIKRIFGINLDKECIFCYEIDREKNQIFFLFLHIWFLCVFYDKNYFKFPTKI